jgi:transmembrane 9 superfamily protein 2/4
MILQSILSTVLLCATITGTSAFYMPGVKPETFSRGDEVPMKVNAMTSIHTQIPKPYYRLPFCQPTEGPKMASENLGEFLTGNKIQTSAYTINMMEEMYCNKLCQITLDKDQAKILKKHTLYGYHNNWIIDNMPSASISNTKSGHAHKHYAGGFPIGFVDRESKSKRKAVDKDVYVFNHVHIALEYHEPVDFPGKYRVVGFAVEPLSVKHAFLGGYEWDGETNEGFSKLLSTCKVGEHLQRNQIARNQIVKEGEKILYTYDVQWKKSDVEWASRWDIYLNEGNLIPAQVHWYSINNSMFLVVFLSVLVVSVLVRNLKKDIAVYNTIKLEDVEIGEDDEDESGWKLIHADVFRPPQTMPLLYCVLIGSGVQLVISVLSAICLAAIGFINPSRRGSMLNYLLSFYMLCGIIAGFTSSRLYKAFRGRSWQLCTLATATLFPGTCFALFLFFNTVLAFFRSSGAVPLLDVLIMAAMWCCVSIPLVFVGAYFGYKKEAIHFPTVTSTIARAIPPSSNLLMNPKFAIVAAGVFPFGAAYVELFFIMTSLWMDQYYYVFGFTLAVYLILLITSAEITLLTIYYQLVAENHRWWWLALMTSGSVSFYIFGYSIIWFHTLDPSKLLFTYMLYFGYMFLLCFTVFITTGAVGSLTSLWFVKMIFGSIKVD